MQHNSSVNKTEITMTTNVNLEKNACDRSFSRAANNSMSCSLNYATTVHNAKSTRNDGITGTNVTMDETCKQKTCKHSETFTLFITKFTLIDTAEEIMQWSERARTQWGGQRAVAVRVSSQDLVRGMTVAQKITYVTKQGWSGLVWDKTDGIAIPLHDAPLLLLEVVSVRKPTTTIKHNISSGNINTTSKSKVVSEQMAADNTKLTREMKNTKNSNVNDRVNVDAHGNSNNNNVNVDMSKEGKVIGVGMLNAHAMLSESRQFAKFCVHIIPTTTAIDENTIHALVEAEIHSSALDEPPEANFSPLEYNYGSVRVSTVDFYYPPFLLTGDGEYIVSNVICAMNMTESSSLAMQLVPLESASKYIVAESAQVITVRPQQRVYFSATWVLTQRAIMCNLEMQLKVNGLHAVSAPIIIKLHISVPQPLTVDIPYHYWINTTQVTNRQFLSAQELPLVRTVLPVYRFMSNGPINQTEGILVAFDKDRGEQVLVRANGVPVTMGQLYNHASNVLFGENNASGGYSDCVDLTRFDEQLAAADGALSNASFVVRDTRYRGAFPARGPVLDLYQKTCRCTIVLGTIHGFPMVYETLTGISPSFQISLTLLDQQGWQIIHGETLPSYQSASGSLRWNEQLVLRKWPGAQATQFVRVNLTEVRARDGDETPIGAGLISLPNMHFTYAHTTLSVAFYVYETYSLYDQLNSPSLLMKDVNVIFSDMR